MFRTLKVTICGHLQRISQSIQFATWMIADDTDFTELPPEGSSALGDLIGGDNKLGGLGDFLQSFITSIAPDAKTWLDKCQIEIGDN